MLAEEQARYAQAVATGDFATVGLFSGEGIDLVRDAPAAAELVRRMSDEAVACLHRAVEFF